MMKRKQRTFIVTTFLFQTLYITQHVVAFSGVHGVFAKVHDRSTNNNENSIGQSLRVRRSPRARPRQVAIDTAPIDFDNDNAVVAVALHNQNENNNNESVSVSSVSALMNKDRNPFQESAILLSRAFEVGSVALSTATPLLLSGIGISSNTFFSKNNSQKDASGFTDHTTAIAVEKTSSSSNNSINENSNYDHLFWEKFWSIQTSNSNSNSIYKQQSITNTISNAERVVQALQTLGPTYVKFGQALSSRADIIPKTLALELSKLQNEMEPFDTNLAKSIIERELLYQPRSREQYYDTTSNGNGATDSDVFIDNDDDVHVVDNMEDIQSLIDSLSEQPVAAASVGQVYKGYLPNYGHVAVKVQRPEVQSLVEKDFYLLRSFASFVESLSIPNINLHEKNKRLVNTELVAAVDEFMSRIFEELDYTNEANNAKTFAQLYCKKNGSRVKTLPKGQGVIVPQIISSLCTTNVLVMEWIEGSKLTTLSTTTTRNNEKFAMMMANDVNEEHDNTRSAIGIEDDGNNYDDDKDDSLLKENLALIEQALHVTLSQLLDTGVMHADPHGGNLLKVSQFSSTYSSKSISSTMKKNSSSTMPTLAYLDFGLLATIPSPVRDGLVCAVASLIFAKDVEAVASLFGELDLLPPEVINDPVERKALTRALTKTMEEVLVYPQGETLFSSPSNNSEIVNDCDNMNVIRSRFGSTRTKFFPRKKKQLTTVPSLKFDKLLDGLTRLVPRFKFRLPPYFINNARALGTLEGIARALDPEFNCLKLMYPYALYRLLQNPTGSPVVEATLQNLIRSDITGQVDTNKISKMLRDSALFTGYSRRKVLMDILKTKGGKRVVVQSLASEFKRVVLKPLARRINRLGYGGRYNTYLKL